MVGRLSQQQKVFNNYQLSRARVVVEHAYRRLKGRWRCLLKRLDVCVRDVPKLVATCCVLHNVCEVRGDTFNEEWLEGVESGCDTSTNIVGSIWTLTIRKWSERMASRDSVL